MTQTGFGYKYCSYLVVFSSLRIHFSFRLCFWVDCHILLLPCQDICDNQPKNEVE
ncbi:unnamed protein product, partial [Mycena citricolor]